MTFANVKLILTREIRDQLRDRRTLFMVLVLPILLYPLLGMSFVQIQQFLKQKPARIWVVGARQLRDLPTLIDGTRFANEVFDNPVEERDRLLLSFPSDEAAPQTVTVEDLIDEARQKVLAREYDAAICFPEGFGARAAGNRTTGDQATANQATGEKDSTDAASEEEPGIRPPRIFYVSATEKSLLAFARLSRVLESWEEKLVEKNLVEAGVPIRAAQPFDLETEDLTQQTDYRGAALWSKLLPVMLLLWAMTGAFYPAIDLCAGEKERGTLETLLSSPAERSEIVLGKLLTVMLFSMLTAVLNLISIGITAWLVFSQRPEFALPSPSAIGWLALALVPIAALFSALCLALAAFARSSKEGQYYLMPLMLVTMPLAVMPMSGGVELNLGNSLIPVSNVVLLLRMLLEGNYWPALQYAPIVIAVTLIACMLAIRWAVDQFNSEAVLFRESERLDLRLWLRHLFRDRKVTPTVAAAGCCAVLILVLRFYLGSLITPPTDFAGFLRMQFAVQFLVIAGPPVAMALLLTRSTKQTLLLRSPPSLALPAAVLMAIVLHPVINAIGKMVTHLYPMDERIGQMLQGIFTPEPPLWQILLVIAVLPAICEELAFRGFILSGFRHMGHKWRAIVFSSVLFGFAHMVLQQQLIAGLVGLVIGYIAVQSGSIWPCMLFHVTNNSLGVLVNMIPAQTVRSYPILNWMMTRDEAGAYSFAWPVVALGALAAAYLLLWFSRLRYERTEEEQLQETIERIYREDMA